AYNPTAWGYAEQTSPGGTGAATMTIYFGDDNPTDNPTKYAGPPLATVSHTMGAINNPTDFPWDYFPFNDRDFASPAELLLVPGCPPGLFTKQFVEDNDPFDRNTVTGAGNSLLPASTAQPTMGPLASSTPPLLTAAAPGEGTFPQDVVRTYPYLIDKFY